MSYNTRRGSGGQNMMRGRGRTPSQQPMPMNKFVSGGQLAQKTVQQNQQQQQRPGSSFPQTSTNAQGQAQTPYRPSPQVQNQRLQQQQVQQTFLKPVAPSPVAQAPAPAPTIPLLDIQPAAVIEETKDEAPEKVSKKPIWALKAARVSKKERQKRRNARLSKILQPKNAVMILNELVKNRVYTVSDSPNDLNQYIAHVQVEGVTHSGSGRSKMEAKNVAAENAIKHIVKTRQFSFQTKDEDGDEKMETDTEESPNTIPWQHVASFALYKLLHTWGDDLTLPRATPTPAPQEPGNSAILTPESSTLVSPAKKPAKKLPENAARMNPLMLVNQMLPHAQFEEIGRTGNPPNIYFSYNCNINEKSFKGTGTSKKAAKINAAFAVCKDILEIQYPPEIYSL